MDLETNQFKKNLGAAHPQVGFWLVSASETVTEIVGGSGFDWVLVDAEHSPNEVPTILSQLRILQASLTSAVVRPPSCDPVIIKRLLDCGAQTLLVPMINTVDEAERAVKAIRYPPRGIRGVSMGHRANAYGRIHNYHAVVEEQLCLILQIETLKAVENLEEIAAVDGVDALFVGPADLSADMGYLGQPGHPEVHKKIASINDRCRAASIRLGTLVSSADAAQEAFDQGMSFVAAATDAALLRGATDELLRRIRVNAP